MRISIIATFQDLFNETPPSLEILLKGIPSKVVISVLAVINAELYIDQDKQEVQLKLLNFITRRFPQTEKNRIARGLDRLKNSADEEEKPFPMIFSVKHTLEFIHYELTHFRQVEDALDDTTPEQELNIFKAYLLIGQQIGNRYDEGFQREGPTVREDFFYRKTWPIMIDQFKFAAPIDPFYQLMRGVTFLNFFQLQPKYKRYIENFLNLSSKHTTWQYLVDLSHLLTLSWQENDDSVFRTFCINADSSYSTLLDHFCLNVNDYNSDTKKHQDFIGIRAKPLFRLNEGQYLVLNWNFLSSSLYDGLLYDFYERSGINELKEFKQFTGFKSFVSTAISEKILFRRIFNYCLNRPNAIVAFDEGGERGLPDCYYRVGKYVFLIEFKDVSMPANVINQSSYSEIKREIDRKFFQAENSGKIDAKGIGQIIKQLNKLIHKPFSFDDYTKKGIKTRNLVIYPIIVYTDDLFAMSGVNHYLSALLRQKLQEESVLQFVKVNDLCMIHFKFFYENLTHFQKGTIKLKDVTDTYLETIAVRVKKENKFRNVDNLLKVHENFEEVNRTATHKLDRGNFVKALFDSLNLLESFNG